MTKRRLPPIKSLIALDAIVRTGSVSAAAEQLSVTHGAVSKQLAQLETWLGMNLFCERRRGMIVNEAGARLAASVESALNGIESALADVSASKGQAALTVVAPATFAMRWLMPRLPAFAQEHPGIGVQVRPTHTTEDWDALGYDLVVRRAEPLPERLGPRPFYTESLGLLVPAALAGSAADPASLAFVDAATRTGDLSRWCTHALKGTPKRPPKVYPHFYIALEAALSGIGAIVAPVDLLAAQILSGALVEPWPSMRIAGARQTIGVNPDGQNPQAAETLARWMQREWQNTPAPISRQRTAALS
ncbi:LysR substrate-binding domain-containing protein [Acuticoccus sp. MNP-M23]|uniref:LysR family transcriptional regulator n=1 Tax=Acuticoccus sp. MNP-M23 TaxID=3072793 RepID=UPI00281586E9|nr:LysR substrate-binding domain-containing protein [Acuticoccus sp. MNP-M23]WMS41824.1 LysR substrate-binding domain-containing protein [Acuticoccus sp. MNP-M23]